MRLASSIQKHAGSRSIAPHKKKNRFWTFLNSSYELPFTFTKVKYKIDHISKTKRRKKNWLTQKSVSEHCASLESTKFFLRFWSVIRVKTLKIMSTIDYNSKTQKIRRSKNWFFIRFSILCIIHANMIISEWPVCLSVTRHCSWSHLPQQNDHGNICQSWAIFCYIC